MRPSPDLSWFVEARGVTLVSPDLGAFLSIPYPHAGLWAILADGSYSLDRARELMALLMATDEDQAEREIGRTLTAWRDTGLLVAG